MTENAQAVAPTAKYATPAERVYRIAKAVRDVTMALVCKEKVSRATAESFIRWTDLVKEKCEG